MEQVRSPLHPPSTSVDPFVATRSVDVLAESAHALSHDVRAPLLTIQGFSKELAQKSAFDDDARHLVDRIVANAQSAQERLIAVVDYERIATRGLSLSRLDIGKLATEELTSLASSKEIERPAFQLSACPDAIGDEFLVRMLLRHLLQNAIQFRSSRELLIEVSGRSLPAMNLYAVRDNGVGFSQNFAEKLFSLFRRAHSQAEFPGLGTGLAFAQLIASRHGGKMWCTSALNEGSTFYFALPAPRSVIVEPKTGPRKRSADPALLSVIIVEDNEDDAHRLIYELRRAGWSVASRRVENEAEFRRELMLGADVILADYTLPQFSVERALEIRSEMKSDAPLIVVTGSIGEETAVQCIKKGASDYLLKDRLTRLASSVEYAMSAAEQARERYRAERARDTLIRELDHRVLNNLAAIVGLIDLGANSGQTPDYNARTLAGRVRAMEIAHRELAARHWLGADLRTILTRATALGAGAAQGELRLDCDNVDADIRSAVGISIAIFELASNAARHGAWSNGSGRVQLEVRREGDEIRIKWSESGGPPIQDEPSPRIGLKLILNQLAHEAEAETTVKFEPTGLIAEFVIPIQSAAILT